jgi:replicative DNA helicase
MEFTVDYQVRLLALFVLKKNFYYAAKDYVEVEFFNAIFLQWVYNLLERYTGEYKACPTKVVIEQELKNDKTFIHLPEEQTFIDTFFSLIDKPVDNAHDLKYVEDTFLHFVKNKAIRKTLGESDEHIEKGDFDALFSAIKEQSRKFDINENEESGLLFNLFNIQELYEERQGIRSSIDLIDFTVGGLKAKEISLVLADTNVGKSLYLVNVGGSAVRQQKRVLHVTLEMSKARTLIRYLANLADDDDNITYQNLINLDPAEEVYEFVHTKLRERYEGYLNIVEFPTGKCTIENLYNLIDKYNNTDLLIVDYLQLLKAPKRRDQLRFELSDIAIALRGIATETNLHVATAQQASKLAANRRLVGKEFTAEDYGIFRVIDVGIGMGQDRNDALKREVVFWLTKSRNTEKNIAERYFIDFQRMRFVKLRQENLTGDGDGH